MNRVILIIILMTSTIGGVRAEKLKWETYSCTYLDLKKDITLDGRCHKQISKIHGNFAYILTWASGNKVIVEYVNSQSGHHIWKINDQSAVAIEVDREHLKGFSLDLNQMLEWQDRATY